MKKLLLLALLGHLVVSCGNVAKKNIENISIEDIEGWNVTVKKGITDTLNTLSWAPEAEWKLEFSNASSYDCLIPRLELYPIALKKYIDQNLMYHLTLRSTLFPPSPHKYQTEEYYILGWNLVDYNGFKCCDCLELESELIDKLQLEVIESRGVIDFTKLD